MTLLKTTSLATMSAMLMATGAAAADMMIENIPDSGQVNLTGTVDMIDDENEFTLRDDNGETIEVESDMPLNVSQGDRVRVNGMVDRGILGMDTEIEAASVTIIDAANAGASLTDRVQPGNNGMSQAATASAGAMAYNDARQDRGQRDMENDRYEQDNEEWHGGEYGAIDQLPDSGQVTLTGTVASVDADDNAFTVRDNTGETIDIISGSANQLNAGDKVRVSGQMNDEALGLGEEILAARIQVMR